MKNQINKKRHLPKRKEKLSFILSLLVHSFLIFAIFGVGIVVSIINWSNDFESSIISFLTIIIAVIGIIVDLRISADKINEKNVQDIISEKMTYLKLQNLELNHNFLLEAIRYRKSQINKMYENYKKTGEIRSFTSLLIEIASFVKCREQNNQPISVNNKEELTYFLSEFILYFKRLIIDLDQICSDIITRTVSHKFFEKELESKLETIFDNIMFIYVFTIFTFSDNVSCSSFEKMLLYFSEGGLNK